MSVQYIVVEVNLLISFGCASPRHRLLVVRGKIFISKYYQMKIYVQLYPITNFSCKIPFLLTNSSSHKSLCI